jgi:hypothetical protein
MSFHRQSSSRNSTVRVFILLASLGLISLVVALDTYPRIWFDEGYKLNAAFTFLQYGVYGTHTVNGFLPFDPGISSGPVDVLAVALSFKLFGVGIISARLVSVIFSLLAVFSLYHIAVYLYDTRASLFIILGVIAFPAIEGTGLFLIGRQVLGEPAALGLITAGLWLWFRSWTNNSNTASLVAGLLIGLGLLSKTQIAIALLPTLFIIGMARGLRYRSHWLNDLLPVVAAVGVILVWMIIGRLFTPVEEAHQNSRMLLEAVRTNLITGLWGRSLTGHSLLILAVMGVGLFSGLWRWYQQGVFPRNNAAWAEAAVTLFVGLSAIWFALLSVGWPRYAFAGLVFSLLLNGKLAWNLFRRVMPAHFYRPAIGALCALTLVTNLAPIAIARYTPDAQVASAYIQANIPKDAVVETWEWELDALSLHSAFHHPPQDYLFEAIRQFSHEKRDFDLDYDALRANPDYIVTGGFSDWTGIYKRDVLYSECAPVTEIGIYRIFDCNQASP